MHRFIHHIQNKFQQPNRNPQPSTVNETHLSSIHLPGYLYIFVPQLVCGHVIRWTHAYKLHSLVMPNETYGTIVKIYCISIQSVGSSSHLASFRCMPGSTRVDEKGHCESSQSLGSRERTGSLGHRIIQGETCLVGGSIFSIQLPIATTTGCGFCMVLPCCSRLVDGCNTIINIFLAYTNPTSLQGFPSNTGRCTPLT